MRTNIPQICEGEIIEVQASPEAIKKNVVRYIVKVQLPNGSEIVVPNAITSTLFGGIDDYFQIRARTSVDSGDSFEPSTNDENENARIGQRVYVSFIGGSLTKPVIIGYAQHPNQTQEFENPEDLKPQAVLKYLGMRFDIKDDGVFRITHYGAPEIKYVKSGGLLGAAAAAISGAAGALSALSDNPIEPDKENPAVTPADASKRTFIEFKDTGGLEVRDSLNQLIHVDTKGEKIYIANNDVQGGPQILTNSTDSEYVLLDRTKKMVLINAREIAQIYSFGRRKDVTDGDHSHKVGGNEEITVFKNKTDKIIGSLEESVTLNYKQSVMGTYDVDVTGPTTWKNKAGVTFDITADMTIGTKIGFVAKTSGATLKLGPANVALGVGGVEVLKTLSDTIDNLSKTVEAILQITVPTALGPSGTPINSVSFMQLIPKLAVLKAKLDAITGSL